MRVIIANGGFLPATTYGGPVVSIDNLCSILYKDIDFYVICTDHELGTNKRLDAIIEGWNERDNCKVRYFSDSEVTQNNINEVIKQVKPDAIYINSLFDAMWTIPLLRIAKKNKIRIILAPRGQLCKNAFTKKYKKIPYIFFLRFSGLLKNAFFQSTSEEETITIKKYLGGTEEKIYFLTNLPSLPKTTLAHPEKNKGKANIVFFSRIVPKKNLISAIKYFENIDGIVSFDIFGPIEDEGYWNDCKKEISHLPKNISVNYKGIINHDRVFQILAQYDAFLFPTWSENFGHVIAEALFSECPVIISDQTPWSGLEKVDAGWAISLKDKDGFINALSRIIQNNNIEQNKMRIGARKYVYSRFNLDRLKNEYRNAFDGKEYT